MTLSDYLARYDRCHDVSDSTIEHYKWVVRSFERLSGPVELDKLNADSVNTWLAWLKENGRSPWTIKQRKISLLVLWRAAWNDGVAPPVEPVRKLKPLHHCPDAWTLSEIRQLLVAAENSKRVTFWSSLIRAGYDTGLRLGDLLAIRIGQASSTLRIVQKKTGQPVAIRLRPETLQAVQEQCRDREASEPVWPLWGRREAFYRAFRRLVQTANIRPGTFRWLRRTACTQLEIVEPGRGTELLGHASRSTTETWYLDRSQLVAPPLPPW